MSRTDKTDPYFVKVKRYGAHYWLPFYRCGPSCDCADPSKSPRANRRRVKKEMREWEKEYE